MGHAQHGRICNVTCNSRECRASHSHSHAFCAVQPATVLVVAARVDRTNIRTKEKKASQPSTLPKKKKVNASQKTPTKKSMFDTHTHTHIDTHITSPIQNRLTSAPFMCVQLYQKLLVLLAVSYIQ